MAEDNRTQNSDDYSDDRVRTIESSACVENNFKLQDELVHCEGSGIVFVGRKIRVFQMRMVADFFDKASKTKEDPKLKPFCQVKSAQQYQQHLLDREVASLQELIFDCEGKLALEALKGSKLQLARQQHEYEQLSEQF